MRLRTSTILYRVQSDRVHVEDPSRVPRTPVSSFSPKSSRWVFHGNNMVKFIHFLGDHFKRTCLFFPKMCFKTCFCRKKHWDFEMLLVITKKRPLSRQHLKVTEDFSNKKISSQQSWLVWMFFIRSKAEDVNPLRCGGKLEKLPSISHELLEPLLKVG